MSNLVIVAIPDENDRVWKVSSEKVPHLTMLFLGDGNEVSNLDQIVQFVEHAASTTLKRFYLTVDRRGELGTDKADVLFFKKSRYDFKAIRDFRATLLQDNNIKTAHDSAAQHDGPWLPHLTLGYPATPANKIPDDQISSFYDVSFNKIAVWTDDFEGPEFLLKDYWDEYDVLETMPMDVAMSDIQAAKDGALTHYGVKGMKWGQRKEDLPAEAKKGRFDPEGHDLTSDVIKSVLWPMVPPLGLFAIPADVRLIRGGARAANSKLIDMDEKKFQARAQSEKNFVKIHNGASERINREVPAINAKHPGDLTKDAKKQKAYDADVLKLMQDSYKESANSIGNKKRTMHLDLEFKNDGMDFSIKAKEGQATPIPKRVQHATEDELEFEVDLEFTGKIKRDTTGHILGFDFDGIDQTMAQTVDLGAEFLAHYGVKGMHWGQRKAPPEAVPTSAMSHVPHGSRRKTKIETEGGENHPAHEDAIKVAEARTKLAKSGAAALSNKELKDVANRLQLEQQVKQLTAPAGKKFVSNLLKNQGNQQANQFVGQQVRKAATRGVRKAAVGV